MSFGFAHRRFNEGGLAKTVRAQNDSRAEIH